MRMKKQRGQQTSPNLSQVRKRKLYISRWWLATEKVIKMVARKGLNSALIYVLSEVTYKLDWGGDWSWPMLRVRSDGATSMRVKGSALWKWQRRRRWGRGAPEGTGKTGSSRWATDRRVCHTWRSSVRCGYWRGQIDRLRVSFVPRPVTRPVGNEID